MNNTIQKHGNNDKFQTFTFLIMKPVYKRQLELIANNLNCLSELKVLKYAVLLNFKWLLLLILTLYGIHTSITDPSAFQTSHFSYTYLCTLFIIVFLLVMFMLFWIKIVVSKTLDKCGVFYKYITFLSYYYIAC